jgi:hypothetical protein
LQSCLPEALAVDHEQLFFQAGFAAGSAKRSMRLFWPSAAAAMLLLSIGLGVALYRQAMAVDDLQTLLASARSSPGQAVGPIQNAANAANDLPAKPQTQVLNAAVDINDRLFSDDRLRRWQRLASPAPLPPGRLTALGWEQLPAEMASWGMGNGGSSRSRSSIESESERDSRLPHRPATYLELLRLYQEG